jgi:hypothetical protein
MVMHVNAPILFCAHLDVFQLVVFFDRRRKSYVCLGPKLDVTSASVNIDVLSLKSVSSMLLLTPAACCLFLGCRHCRGLEIFGSWPWL